MKALVIGRCLKTVEQLDSFCESVIIFLDNSFLYQRDFPEFKNYRIEYSNVKINTVRGILPRAKEIYDLIHKYDFDIVFTNTKWDMVAAKLASIFVRKRVVLLSTSHNSYAWSKNINVWVMTRLISWTTHCYIALASFVSNKLQHCGLNREHILLIPNTVNVFSWQEKKDYSYVDNIKIVYVACVYPGKNQDFIIEVLNRLKNKYKIIVDCYGDLDEEDSYVISLREKIKKYNLENIFNLKGRIDNNELRGRLKDYDIYFCPSLMEMSPVNILEAQAVGLPVLATNVGGVCDLICHEKTGILFSVNNLQEAISSLERLMKDEDLREYLGRNARNFLLNENTTAYAGKIIKEKIDSIKKTRS